MHILSLNISFIKCISLVSILSNRRGQESKQSAAFRANYLVLRKNFFPNSCVFCYEKLAMNMSGNIKDDSDHNELYIMFFFIFGAVHDLRRFCRLRESTYLLLPLHFNKIFAGFQLY